MQPGREKRGERKPSVRFIPQAALGSFLKKNFLRAGLLQYCLPGGLIDNENVCDLLGQENQNVLLGQRKAISLIQIRPEKSQAYLLCLQQGSGTSTVALPFGGNLWFADPHMGNSFSGCCCGFRSFFLHFTHPSTRRD